MGIPCIMLKDTQRQKLQKLSNETVKQNDSIFQLNKVRYLKSNVMYSNKKRSIILLDNVEFVLADWYSLVYILEHTIENIDSKYLSFIKPVFYVTSSSAIDFESDSVLYFPSYTYLWKKSEANYIFKFRFSGLIITSGIAQSYLNLHLIISNPRVWNEISNNKT